ncbi:MAG: NAD(P)-binding domain-containing protein [Flavobacteriales bacterium]|nr:NAD(P)-binding domain-containing protein [Flavobacteriales bacterium]
MAKISVLGTGNVGNTIAGKCIELGHQVMMGSRTKDNEKALSFAASNPGNSFNGTFAEASAFSEIIFNCTQGLATLDVLKAAGEDNLKGKILIDVSNPLDFSNGMPPTLSVCNTSSLGEEIQKAFPDLKVVKALNTTWCGIMVNPRMIGDGDHSTFICGNDDTAKQEVKAVLMTFGWHEKNILDLGDITAARGMEMYLPLWLRIWGATKNGAFNVKIVS